MHHRHFTFQKGNPLSGPLSNIKVLDLSRILAGPWASQILGDMGADVIKVERPKSGDDTRQWGPPYAKDKSGSDASEAAYYLAANRNKKSLTLDFTAPEGRDILLKLAAKSDIFLENYKLGGLKKYGLDYESLKKLNPKIIYCSITGFGQTGPYAHKAGYDFLIQGMGGLMSVTGESDAHPGGGPQKVGVAHVDVMTGLYAVIAILGALHHRRQSGVGQYIDLALFDVQVATLANQGMNFLTSGIVPKRLGNAHPNIVPYQAVKTKNGHIILAIGNDGQFKRFSELIGYPELSESSDYATNPARVANRVALMTIIEKALSQHNTEEWVEMFESHAVPCGPINTIDRVFDDPQIKARQMQLMIEHPTIGEVPQVKTPIHYSDTPLDYCKAPPTLGQHVDEVLTDELGLSTEAIKLLRDKGVI